MKNRVQTVAVTVLLAAAISTAALVEFCSIFIGYRILRGSCWLLARHVSTLKEFSVAAAAATAYFNPDIEPGAAYKVVLGVPAVLCYASVALAICWLSDREGARAMDKKRIEDRCAAKKDKAEQRCVSSQQGSKRKKRKKRKKGKGKGREQAATPLTIFVRDLCSKTVAVYMAQDARTTVADLKILICEKTNVPAALQSLAFSGKRAAFADGALLADCSIGCGSTVTLMLAGGLCGGMGCGPSKPSSDDGSAYREGVALISVLKVYEASEVNKEVKKMVGKIKEQMREMQANATYMEEHGTLPPALAAASVDEAMEAIGSLVVTKVNLEVQVEETIYTVMASGFDIEIGKGRARELLADLDTINTQLAIATALFTGVWKLELPPQPKEVTNRKKFKRLPLANAAGALSQLAVIGWVYLNDAAKGVEAKDEYVEYVVVPGAAVEKGCSVRLKPEEGRVQTVATWHDGRGRVVQKVRCADLEPGVVGRVDKLWQGGKGGDCVVLPSGRKTSNTFPKDKLEVVTKVINPSIKAFLAARVDKVEALTLTIVIDIESYGAEFAKQLKAAQPNTMEEVAAAVQQAVKGAPSKAEIANLTADPEAPPPEQIEYGAYMQRIAGPVSIGLYLVVTQLIASTPNAAGAYCVPGPVKGLRRMVAKTIAKYTSFANCRDLARCTVQVPTLDALAAFLKALVDCKQVTILRIKNRFADDYDPLPAGGYRDVQVLLLLPEGGGTVHRYAELQINLEAMVKIKNGKGAKGGGGHDAFNLARAIDAFSPRTLRYQGNPNDDVWQSMKVGGLLEVDFQDSDLSTPEVQKKLTEAIRPAQCRVRELTCVGSARAGLSVPLFANVFGSSLGLFFCSVISFLTDVIVLLHFRFSLSPPSFTSG